VMTSGSTRVEAFTTTIHGIPLCNGWKECRSRRTQTGMSNIFDSFRRYLDQDNNSDNDEDQAAGTTRLITIAADTIKPGGLRLLIMFYLIGMQNTPERGSWTPSQPSKDEYVVDFFFHDRSAMLSVNLLDREIVIERTGSVPTNAYMMQETVVIEGILNELHQCAFDESIPEAHRLLILQEPKDCIERARDSLAFR
jgi:hypothetical protein